MLKFQRGVHTRAKKISVQLLKDFKHVGIRGEVVQVTEGLMRNKLHPHNGAAYMVSGPVIPIVKKPVKVATKKTETAKESQQPKESVLDLLVFKSSGDEGTQKEQPSAQAAAQNAIHNDAQNTQTGGFEWQNQFIQKSTEEK